MPEFNAPGLATIAQNLIDRFGGMCELHLFDKPAADTTTPWKPQGGAVAERVIKARMVMLPKTREREAPMRYADGTEQRVGDLNVYMGAALSVPPNVGGFVLRGDGSKWWIKTLAPLDPNGIVLLYEGWLQR